jgi:N-acetyl sugar amidotransferase
MTTRHSSIGDMRLVCDYFRSLRNEIALDLQIFELAGLDPSRYGKFPRPSRWIAKAKRFDFLSRLLHRLSLPIWFLLGPLLFSCQYKALRARWQAVGPVRFDETGQVLAFSNRTLDIVQTRYIDPAPRQWIELPWLPLSNLPHGAEVLSVMALLSEADIERSLTLATLAHRALQKRRGMSDWGLQSYTALRWFLVRLAVDKLPGPLLSTEHFNRWAVLVDQSVRRSSNYRQTRHFSLMQHGSVGANETPRGLGFRLPTRLHAVSHLHAYSAADVDVFMAEILSSRCGDRGLVISFFRPSIILTEMATVGGPPSILFVGYPLCEAAHCSLLKALCLQGDWEIFYKPHPTCPASSFIMDLPWTVVEGRTVFPRVDLVISYPSTLISEYAAHDTPIIKHSMDVTADELLDRLPEIVNKIEPRHSFTRTTLRREPTDSLSNLPYPKMTVNSHKTYRICKQCIMDTSDPSIFFDERGRCGYCNNFNARILPNWHTDAVGERQLERIADSIKSDGKGKDFDCIIGLSGGQDSSYAAYITKEKMGLRPLLFHVDAGWNTDEAVGNIEKLADGLGLDLYTEVVNWEAVRRMQVAFLRAGIPDQDLVQDAAFFSGLYKFARKYKIKHIITGSNFSTESCREPEAWGGYLGIDKTLFGDIWATCGDGKPNDDFPLVDIMVYKLLYQKVLGIKLHHPLNLVPYFDKDAKDELGRRFGWRRFQHKHHESRFTRFFEDYWLPRRFGYDKRRAHFSSLIITGQMTREQALERVLRPEMDEHFLNQEFEYVAHKLGLTVDELQALFDMPKKTYRDYKNKRNLIIIGAKVMRMLGQERRHI